MPRKLLIYAGAPLSDSLDWSPSTLIDSFTEPVARLIGLTRGPLCRDPGLASSFDASDHPAWRSLALKRRRLATGFSQQPMLGWDGESFPPDPGFFTTADVSLRSDASPSLLKHDDEEESSILSQFCERSLAAHNDIPSSQLDAISSAESSFVTDATTSFVSDSTQEESSVVIDDSQPPPAPPPPLHPGVGIAAQVHDLGYLPSAAHLASISPQTMTVNIIVGIISILPKRTVRTRWGGSRSLVEVLVGDETRAGFGITFWLPPSGGKSPVEDMRAQDVVLMRNVALGSFMRKVYGYGLRRDLTKVHLLHRRKLDADDVGGHYSTADLQGPSGSLDHHLHPQLLKAQKVREWVIRFVGGDVVPTLGQKRKKEGRRRRWDVPPPDETQ
ncbi:hypothetical protein MAPG_11085 [Magnaporthiopsis poae ATCC 64411]|uniref:Uncharacterized protein n=1 Tax=Magnaporthiopsis poae (strain ATCC 64411 / 73-15) TaxID=644358 RepID=A0A0C4EEB4_MAGP6|nr:hypothetical protein MAPG_11085 [Magnaporthiopsis poae ATCC 64411]